MRNFKDPPAKQPSVSPAPPPRPAQRIEVTHKFEAKITKDQLRPMSTIDYSSHDYIILYAKLLDGSIIPDLLARPDCINPDFSEDHINYKITHSVGWLPAPEVVE